MSVGAIEKMDCVLRLQKPVKSTLLLGSSTCQGVGVLVNLPEDIVPALYDAALAVFVPGHLHGDGYEMSLPLIFRSRERFQLGTNFEIGQKQSSAILRVEEELHFEPHIQPSTHPPRDTI